ncbi:MAG: glycosyltransferase [Verrucomicrobiota bacterium]
MVVLVHPTGDESVRALLRALRDAGLLARFVTSLGFPRASVTLFPPPFRAAMMRRSYDLEPQMVRAAPRREILHLLAARLGLTKLMKQEMVSVRVDRIYQAVDQDAAVCLRAARQVPGVIYGYEDCAEHSFLAARERGIRRVYDLPSLYGETARTILREEAARYPEWEPTLANRASESVWEQKTRELALAETIICPSRFVLSSLPEEIRQGKNCNVVACGSPAVAARESNDRGQEPLRVLFAGALSQREGLADVFRALQLLRSTQVRLVLMGSLLQPLRWYQAQFPHFSYELPRTFEDRLQLMRSCDVLVLPSLVPGRAWALSEAMSCGLPVIATANAGAEEFIQDGVNGWKVPVRDPESIADRLQILAEDKERLGGMSQAAQNTARDNTWEHYGEAIVKILQPLMTR